MRGLKRFIAAVAIICVRYVTEQRRPGAALRTYIAAIRPQLLAPANPSRCRRIAVAVTVAVGALLVIALLVTP